MWGEPIAVRLYILCDSSPQAGRDWVMTEYKMLSTEHAVAVFEAVKQLFQIKKGESTGCKPEGAESFNTIDAGCSSHMFPPGAVGSRRASLLHKLHAVLHSMRMDLGSWNEVKDFCDDIVAFTTDAGVESGLAKVQAQNLITLPHAHAQREIRDRP